MTRSWVAAPKQKKKKKKKIYIYIYIIIPWDCRRICGPSLNETSLCGVYVYLSQETYSLKIQSVLHETERSIAVCATVGYSFIS
jgi:hypothetical protein